MIQGDDPTASSRTLGMVVSLACLLTLVGILIYGIYWAGPSNEFGHGPRASDNIKDIVLAMHNYEGIHQHLPAAAITSQDGRPLLSWRVAILPFLERYPEANQLYKRFKLDEPWDGPHNIELLAEMPKIYGFVGKTDVKPEKYHTYFQVFVGKGTAFEGTKGWRIPEDFPDGLSPTILIVEGGEPVAWTKPQDIPYAADKPLPRLASVRAGYFLVACVDGSRRDIKDTTPEATVRALITRNGGEKIDIAGLDN
jgi:hypothetical protein